MTATLAKYLEDPSSSIFARCNNFYDWFCSDKALVAKQKSLDAKVRKIAKSPKIDVDTMYVWYKNNCPVMGKLYDDIRISDVITGDVIYNICPKNGHNSKIGLSEVYCRDNGFEAPVVSGTWKDVLNYFEVGSKK
jgi:hypothetical protein